jgi:hypothetical protein
MSDFNIELTLEQQLEIQKLRLLLEHLPKEEIEKMAISLATQSFGYLNAFKSVFNKTIL